MTWLRWPSGALPPWVGTEAAGAPREEGDEKARACI